MSRYVDFYLIGELVDSHGNVHYEDLKNLPTADVIEVVRCRDCKWYTEGLTECEEWQGCGNLGISLPHENWFCAYGERRDDAEIH